MLYIGNKASVDSVLVKSSKHNDSLVTVILLCSNIADPNM